jgi:hypothetical protein
MTVHKTIGLTIITETHTTREQIDAAMSEVTAYCNRFSAYREQPAEWGWLILPHAVAMLCDGKDWKDWVRYRILGR